MLRSRSASRNSLTKTVSAEHALSAALATCRVADSSISRSKTRCLSTRGESIFAFIIACSSAQRACICSRRSTSWRSSRFVASSSITTASLAFSASATSCCNRSTRSLFCLSSALLGDKTASCCDSNRASWTRLSLADRSLFSRESASDSNPVTASSLFAMDACALSRAASNSSCSACASSSSIDASRASFCASVSSPHRARMASKPASSRLLACSSRTSVATTEGSDSTGSGSVRGSVPADTSSSLSDPRWETSSEATWLCLACTAAVLPGMAFDGASLNAAETRCTPGVEHDCCREARVICSPATSWVTRQTAAESCFDCPACSLTCDSDMAILSSRVATWPWLSSRSFFRSFVISASLACQAGEESNACFCLRASSSRAPAWNTFHRLTCAEAESGSRPSADARAASRSASSSCMLRSRRSFRFDRSSYSFTSIAAVA
mmetsp:Transcript_22699/g.52960  ORF Transcript_22699/g.52960 Transcript_22699/m.52960 type:complete len:441 (+) Transcript_22699:1003-2325(+)